MTAAMLFLSDEDSHVLSEVGFLAEEGDNYLEGVMEYLRTNTFGADEVTCTLDGQRVLAIEVVQYIDADPQWALMKRLAEAVKKLVKYFKSFHQHGSIRV